MRGIGVELYLSSGNRDSVGRVTVFGLRWCRWCMWRVGRGLDKGLGGWCYVCVIVGPNVFVRYLYLYLYLYLGGYLRILGVPSVQSGCTLSISVSLQSILFMGDIANPDSFVCGCRTWICFDITRL